VAELTAKVAVELPVPGAAIGLGLKLTVTPLGCPLADSETGLLNPLSAAVATVVVPLFPCATLNAPGEVVRLKSGLGDVAGLNAAMPMSSSWRVSVVPNCEKVLAVEPYTWKLAPTLIPPLAPVPVSIKLKPLPADNPRVGSAIVPISSIPLCAKAPLGGETWVKVKVLSFCAFRPTEHALLSATPENSDTIMPGKLPLICTAVAPLLVTGAL